MTAFRWTFVAAPYGDGREVVHLHLSDPEMEADDRWRETPRAARKADAEALRLFSDIMRGNGADAARADADRMFKGADPIPPDAKPVCRFDLEITHDGSGPKYRVRNRERMDFSPKYHCVWDCLLQVETHLKAELIKRLAAKKG